MSGPTYRLVLHHAVVGEIKKLPARTRREVKAAIDDLASEPIPRAAVRLKGTSNSYRLRFGDYRMLYEVHATEVVVYVLGVGHRREVYRRILRRRKH